VTHHQLNSLSCQLILPPPSKRKRSKLHGRRESDADCHCCPHTKCKWTRHLSQSLSLSHSQSQRKALGVVDDDDDDDDTRVQETQKRKRYVMYRIYSHRLFRPDRPHPHPLLRRPHLTPPLVLPPSLPPFSLLLDK
jgi:hypothetical protein